MIGTIRKHQTWLWWIIAVVTIVSFVILGPTNFSKPTVGGGRGDVDLGAIKGTPITVAQFREAQSEVKLQYMFRNGQWPDRDTQAAKSGFNLEGETYFRLLLIAKEKEFGIVPSPEAVANAARNTLSQMGISPDEFEDRLLKSESLTSADFEGYLTHELGLQQLIAAAGMAGKLVIPQEAEELYRKEHQEIQTTAVFFNLTNYLSGVTASPEAVAQFYSNRVANYRIPDRREVICARFNVTNYLASVEKETTNLTADVDAAYARYGTNAIFKDKTPVEAKAVIRDEMLRRSALAKARIDASKFAAELDETEPKALTNLQALAAKKGLEVLILAPFSEEDGPADVKVSQAFIQAAFQRTSDEPFSGAVPSDDGSYVLGLRRVLPSYVPPLAEIQAKVTLDFRLAQAAQIARMQGAQFASSLTNGLPAGKTFTEVATAARLKPESLPPFSLSTRELPPELEEKISLNTLHQAGFGTPVGHASPFIPTREGGMILFVEKMLPVDEVALKKEMPGFLAYIRQVRQSEAFSLWFNREIGADPAFARRVQQTGERAEVSGPAASKQ